VCRTLRPVIRRVTKKHPDAVNALLVVTAALHGPAQILTSDPEDIRACTATLDHADIISETI
jgi:hypothetical protein